MENQTTELVEPIKFDKSKLFIPASIIVAALIISGTIFYTNFQTKTANIGEAVQPGSNEGGIIKVSEDDDAFLGPKNANVVAIEFSDFQCPFCRKFWKDSFLQLKKEFIDTRKIKFVYRDFPLAFHSMAMPAAQAAECAKEQNKFWQFHDKIFGEQDKKGDGTIQFTVDDIKKWAAEIGIDSGKFNACLDSGKYKEEVQKDYNDGVSYNVSGTPTLFINGKAVVGAQPYEVFKSEIERALKE